MAEHAIQSSVLALGQRAPSRRQPQRCVALAELQLIEGAHPASDYFDPALGLRSHAELACVQAAAQDAGLLSLQPRPELSHIALSARALGTERLRLYCEVQGQAPASLAETALRGLAAALGVLHQHFHQQQQAVLISAQRLLFEQSSDRLWQHPLGLDADETACFRPRSPARLAGRRCAVVTLSDRAANGQYADLSGPRLVQALQAWEADHIDYRLLADEPEALQRWIGELLQREIQLCLCTGGTGLGPRDQTPEALRALGGREVPGLAELFRSQTASFTPLAWLSRACAWQVEGLLLIALPGSPRAVAEAMQVLGPLLAHALAMIEGGDHP